MSNPVVWFEVLGQDADKMRAFYSSLFGWKFNLDPETKYGIVQIGDAGLGSERSRRSPSGLVHAAPLMR